MRTDKPSRTARKIAIGILSLSGKPGMDTVLPPGIVEASAQLLVASGAASPKAVAWAHTPRARQIFEWFDRILPGQFVALAYRKAFCERTVQEGIADGATQVLVLGAGYDTLAWRLAPTYPSVRFFEVDHPATAMPKIKGIEAMGTRENLFLNPEDLSRRRLVDVLGEHAAWDSSAKTVIVAEGLVMYLPERAVEDLFRQCASMVADGSRFAFSYIPSGPDGRPNVGRWTGLMLWLQKAIGEPWLWSIFPDQLEGFLRRNQWTTAPCETADGEHHGIEHFVSAHRRQAQWPDVPRTTETQDAP